MRRKSQMLYYNLLMLPPILTSFQEKYISDNERNLLMEGEMTVNCFLNSLVRFSATFCIFLKFLRLPSLAHMYTFFFCIIVYKLLPPHCRFFLVFPLTHSLLPTLIHTVGYDLEQEPFSQPSDTHCGISGLLSQNNDCELLRTTLESCEQSAFTSKSSPISIGLQGCGKLNYFNLVKRLTCSI